MQPLWSPAGCTFFTRSESLLGRLIRWAETDPGEEPTWSNHTGIVISEGWLVPPEGIEGPLAVVVEALWKTQEVEWWTAHSKEYAAGQRIKVFQPVPPFDTQELQHFINEARHYVGSTYGWWRLLLQLGDRLVFKGNKVLSKMNFSSRPICSWLAAFVNQKAQSTARGLQRLREKSTNGLQRNAIFMFGMAPESADPDELLDYCLEHPDEWKEIL